MNIDNNSDPNESLEAPEDDDFGDFEAAEDEAPEAVQAMVGGPNWVYPDLVRIQSSSNSNAQNDANPGINNNYNNRIMNRVLDPPDVSLLTSNANSSKPPQNTLDLCSSLGSSNVATNNLSLFNTLLNNNHAPVLNKSGLSIGPTSASSPSSGSSSSSLAVTNLSGLILSNSSATSSPSLSQNNKHNDHFQSNNNMMDTTNANLSPIPSTSNGITSSHLNMNLKNPLEQRIRALQIENRLLQDQLNERDKKINDLHRLGAFSLEDSLGRRIENVLERIESKMETSVGNLTNRVEALERKTQNMHLPGIPNGMMANDADTKTNDINNCPQSSASNDQFLQLFERLKLEQQQESQKLLRILANILSNALQEINNNHTFH